VGLKVQELIRILKRRYPRSVWTGFTIHCLLTGQIAVLGVQATDGKIFEFNIEAPARPDSYRDI